ncbi:hypothetical protein [Brevundimonas variabilis]|uniref:Uncharacterized protein n=1 Tax=Brevundimonas variabilis TaxID=74312 RepID=A0A7W9CFU2_9CAUL|nr:hypothetical protein [Brevundimonas variabilis]MBB5744875.1 hypothetical protein [Brevundimonas variabilis]
MDLLEHYLAAVAAQLDRGQREDIIAELRDTLLTRFEEREAALGRDLTDSEREAILREMGHPLVVAARYGKGPQHLVGPDLFPWWLFAVKAGLLIIVALHLVDVFFSLFAGAGGFQDAIRHLFIIPFEAGLVWIGIATVAAYVIERTGWRPGFMTDWRVKDLPVLKLSDPEAWRAAMTGEKERPAAAAAWAAPKAPARWPAGEAIFGILVLGVFIAWWGGFQTSGMQPVTLSRTGELLTVAPVWAANFVPILLLAIFQLWIELLRLMRPQWVRFIAGLQVVAAGVGIAILWTIFQVGHWFTLSDGETSIRVIGGWSQLMFERLRDFDDGPRDLSGNTGALSLILSWVFAGAILSLGFSMLRHLATAIRGRA